MKVSILYIPGLNDTRYMWQQAGPLRLWAIYGVSTTYIPMNWSDGRPFSEKLQKVLEKIDSYHANNYRVCLIGTSAGASVAINAFANRKDVIHRVVCVSGKLQNPNNVHRSTFLENPAFEESLQVLPSSLLALDPTNRKQILSLHPIIDNLVPVPDTFLDGASSGRLPISGHGLSILYALTLGSYRIVRFFKS